MSRRGFTLLEVLIAIALLMALVGAMFGFLFDMLSARARALEHARQHDAASAVIRQLDLDLTTCVIGAQGSVGPGIKGDEQSVRVLTRGVAASLAARGVDDPAVLGDLQATEIRWDDAARRVELHRGAVQGGEMESTAYAPLEGAIYKLRFRYHNGDQWLSSFDSVAQGRLPAAVEIAIWLDPLPGQDETELEEQALDPATEAAMERERDEAMGFDERSFAFESDRQTSEPPPSRIRVIAVPDSDPEESSEGDDASR